MVVRVGPHDPLDGHYSAVQPTLELMYDWIMSTTKLCLCGVRNVLPPCCRRHRRAVVGSKQGRTAKLWFRRRTLDSRFAVLPDDRHRQRPREEPHYCSTQHRAQPVHHDPV